MLHLPRGSSATQPKLSNPKYINVANRKGRKGNVTYIQRNPIHKTITGDSTWPCSFLWTLSVPAPSREAIPIPLCQPLLPRDNLYMRPPRGYSKLRLGWGMFTLLLVLHDISSLTSHPAAAYLQVLLLPPYLHTWRLLQTLVWTLSAFPSSPSLFLSATSDA